MTRKEYNENYSESCNENESKRQELISRQVLLRKESKKISEELEQMDFDRIHAETVIHLGKYYKTIEKYNLKHHNYHHVYKIIELELKSINVSYWDDNDDSYDINTYGRFYYREHNNGEVPFKERYVEVTKEEFELALEHVKSLIKLTSIL